MLNRIHFSAAILATLTIATFFAATIFVELFGTHQSIASIKALIVMPGLFILVPAIATTGASGFLLSKSRQGKLVTAKLKRMPFIAANGLLILIPCAIFLNHWAATQTFDARFYALQSVEIIAGAINLLLMSLNIRDGLKLRGNIRQAATAQSQQA